MLIKKRTERLEIGATLHDADANKNCVVDIATAVTQFFFVASRKLGLKLCNAYCVKGSEILELLSMLLS
jgi:hypothetical protein